MADKAKKESESPKVSPTGDLLTAHLLAMLNGWSAYGYELAQRLEEAGLGNYNKGSIYRVLRQMEESGLASSNWDTSKEGPARRIYRAYRHRVDVSEELDDNGKHASKFPHPYAKNESVDAGHVKAQTDW